ncbi:MAG: prolyl oligopeptidase family serine peptidase [Candidatus Saccharimonadaceae bacterium]
MKTKYIYYLLALCVTINVCSQQRLKVTEQDYSLWGTLSDESISPDGKWVSYRMIYQSEVDTLFLQHIDTGKKTAFAQASSVTFSPDGNWAAVSMNQNNVVTKNFLTGQSLSFNNAVRFEFTQDGKHLALLSNNSSSNTLSIISEKGKIELSIPGVTEFKISVKNKIAASTIKGLVAFDFKNNFISKKVLLATEAEIKNILWSSDGDNLAFFTERTTAEKSVETAVHFYNFTSETFKHQNAKNLIGYKIVRFSSRPLVLNLDNTHLFFYVQPTDVNSSTTNNVDIWEANSPYEFPSQSEYDNPEFQQTLAIWDIQKDSVARIGTELYPKVLLTADKLNALKYNQSTYEPQYDEVAPTDFYIESINTRKSRLLLKKHTTSSYPIQSSPSGRYLSYFENENWWLYDIKEHSKKNLTVGLPSFVDENPPYADHQNNYYSSPGFTSDSKYLIVYDKYDIWFLSPSKNIRITDGRKNKIRYRIVEDIYNISPQNATEMVKYDFNMEKGFVLESMNETYQSSYGFWNKKNGLQNFNYTDSKKSRLKKAASSEKFIYVEESGSTPPRLVFASRFLDKSTDCFQSNAHYRNYNWPKKEQISYSTKNGKILQGILSYPVDYVPGRKYPMIVYIYEKLSPSINDYHNPSTQDQIGFPFSNYNLNNYFVLMPDIEFEIGNPGLSALNCVESAVRYVIKTGMVQENNIGLVGHSLGGYEASFIATKSDLFKTVVVGAGTSDLVRTFLSINKGKNRSNNWRVERQQYRMGASPFHAYEAYISNSVIPNVAGIRIPMLHWTGENDEQVNWEEGLALHLALRRLGRINTFLVYPNEGHILLTPKNQFDLTNRIKNWFDKYLKNAPEIKELRSAIR